MAVKNISVPEALADAGIPGDVIEQLLDMQSAPEVYGIGIRARLGKVLEQIGSGLLASAREEAKGRVGPESENRFGFEEDGAVFKHRVSGEQTRINTSEVKRRFPEDEYPDLYTKAKIPATVVITYSE